MQVLAGLSAQLFKSLGRPNSHGAHADKFKTPKISPQSLRRALHAMGLVDGQKLKLRDLDIMIAQTGHTQVSFDDWLLHE